MDVISQFGLEWSLQLQCYTAKRGVIIGFRAKGVSKLFLKQHNSRNLRMLLRIKCNVSGQTLPLRTNDEHNVATTCHDSFVGYSTRCTSAAACRVHCSLRDSRYVRQPATVLNELLPYHLAAALAAQGTSFVCKTALVITLMLLSKAAHRVVSLRRISAHPSPLSTLRPRRRAAVRPRFDFEPPPALYSRLASPNIPVFLRCLLACGLAMDTRRFSATGASWQALGHAYPPPQQCLLSHSDCKSDNLHRKWKKRGSWRNDRQLCDFNWIQWAYSLGKDELKSTGLRYGDLSGHPAGPPRPIHYAGTTHSCTTLLWDLRVAVHHSACTTCRLVDSVARIQVIGVDLYDLETPHNTVNKQVDQGSEVPALAGSDMHCDAFSTLAIPRVLAHGLASTQSNTSCSILTTTDQNRGNVLFRIAAPNLLNTVSAYTIQTDKLKYRNRMQLERASQNQSSDAHRTQYDRVKRCRERKINIKVSERVNVDVFTQNKRPKHTRGDFVGLLVIIRCDKKLRDSIVFGVGKPLLRRLREPACRRQRRARSLSRGASAEIVAIDPRVYTHVKAASPGLALARQADDGTRCTRWGPSRRDRTSTLNSNQWETTDSQWNSTTPIMFTSELPLITIYSIRQALKGYRNNWEQWEHEGRHTPEKATRNPENRAHVLHERRSSVLPLHHPALLVPTLSVRGVLSGGGSAADVIKQRGKGTSSMVSNYLPSSRTVKRCDGTGESVGTRRLWGS
ncbi:hypothetical protein PR048_017132 [Dryococelus australis]|uniref:Uncharacterized protein n=1 Tax=Dryococelus australis TaxID=614101 RepID=A0ABQ9H8P7_9NEOP|nr:hypothetical protein PR048_017132 [Dryococelus australis]